MATDERGAGRTYWAMVSGQFRRNRRAVWAGYYVLFMFTVAIFANFLANGYPYYARIENPHLYRTDYNGWTVNHRILTVLVGKPVTTDDARDALDARWRACALKLAQMRLQLAAEPDALAGELAGIYADVRTAAGSEVDGDGAASPDRAALVARLTAAFDLAREQLHPDKVALTPHVYCPLLRQLQGVEVGWMTLYVCTVAYVLGAGRLLARRLERFGAGRRSPQLARIGLLVAVPLVAGIGWRVAFPPTSDQTPYPALAREPGADVRFLPVPYFPDQAPPNAPIYLAPSWTDRYGDQLAVLQPKYEPLTPHYLGTDQYGYDVLSRLIWGARISLSVGFIAVAIYVAIGIVVGALAGYFRGWVDLVVSRVIEVVICFPTMFLIIIIMTYLEPSIVNVMIVIGITGWPGVSRLVRGEFLRLVSSDFVTAARALGIRTPRIIFRHVLPNALSPVLVVAAFGIAGAILTESALSYLGIGVPLDTPSWGALLRGVRSNPQGAWWLTVIPGAAVFLSVTAYNLVAEGMRDAIDPRLKE